MKALGVALAACCAVAFWPSAAHADPIGARVGATTVEHTKIAVHDDDATFSVQGGLDRSITFANTGQTEVFDDDRVSLGDVIDLEGLGLMLHDQITLGLRTMGHDADNDGDHDGGDRRAGLASGSDSGSGAGLNPGVGAGHRTVPALLHGPKVTDPQGGGGTTTSATPEPASMLLLATGLAGVLLYRRRLFA
jgi:hypothetical protein